MDLESYRASISHHGLAPTLFHAAYRVANRVAQVAVWDAMRIDLGMVRELRADGARASGTMLDAEAMRPYVSDPESLLTHDFINEAARKDDRCYALFDGDTLTSYGWYSTQPTRLTEASGEPTLHFDPSYAYMYNGFTRPAYRGRRLHAIGMTAALREWDRAGLAGLVSYVVSSNLASLKSCRRMGYETFGHIWMVRVKGRHVWHSTPGCARYDFRVEAPLG